MPAITLHTTPHQPPTTPAPTNPLPNLLHTPSGLAIVEIQGTINLPQPQPQTAAEAQDLATHVVAHETPVGRIVFPDEAGSRVYMYIGRHQRLTGEVKRLATPLGVLRRRSRSALDGDADADVGGDGEELEILEVVRYKVLFSQRPEPVS